MKKKRMYRALDVKKVDGQKLAEGVRGRHLVFAVDVGKQKPYGALMNERKEVLMLWKWDQWRETPRTLELLESLGASTMEVVLEPSGSYGDPLRHLLMSSGIPVYRVSPQRTNKYAEVYDGVPSHHDGKSAVLLGRLHLEGLSERWTAASEDLRELKSSVTELGLYHDQYHANLNRLEGVLGRYWPELTQYLDLASATLQELLIHYGDPAAIRAEPVQASRRMRRAGRGGLKMAKIDAVLKSARQTIGVPMTAGERHLVQQLASEARRNRRALQEAEKRTKALSRALPSVRALRPLLGEMTAVVMIVRAGDPQDYANPSSYVKSLGLNLKERSSGRHQGQLKITKRGSGMARQWLYLAVLRLLQKDPVVQAWYARKVARDGGVKMKGVVAVMRKVALAIWHVARGETFDATKLFDVRRLDLAS